MTTTLRRVKKLLRRSKHVTDQSLLFNQSNCCYVATQKKVMATTYYVIYIYDWLSYITPNIPTCSHSHSDHLSDEIDAQMIPNYCICCYPRYIPLIYL